jgi:hypothetical protein
MKFFIRYCLLLIFAAAGGIAFADELNGELRREASGSFSMYKFDTYEFTVTEPSEIAVAMKSQNFDSYLMLVSPDGRVFKNDTGKLEDDKGLSGWGDAAIVVDRPALGKWLLITTTAYEGKVGKYILKYSGISSISPKEIGERDNELMLLAFSAKGVADPAIRRDMLSQQLTLKAWRDDMKRQLRLRIGELQTRNEKDEKSLAAKSRKLEELSRSRKTITGKQHAELLGLLDKRLDELSGDVDRGSEALRDLTIELAAYRNALAELEHLSGIADRVNLLEEQVLVTRAPQHFSKTADEIQRLKAELKALGKSFSAKVLESGIVTGLKFSERLTLGPINPRNDRESVDAFAFASPISSIASVERLVDRTSRGREQAGDTRLKPWLPAMLPWPPPMPSCRVVLDRAVVEQGRFKIKKLGDIDDALLYAINKAGYSEVSYWSVPQGFAIVTPVEQIDSTGRPLENGMRWSQKIAQMKDFSIQGYLKALVTAPQGHFRVLVFVASPEPFAPVSTKEVLSTIEKWSTGGLNFIPEPIRSKPVDKRYRITALIYEFKKTKDSEYPENIAPGQLKVVDHFRETRLALFAAR